MFKWKAAEKLAQPKIAEVIAEEELSATTIVEEVAPAPLPVAQLLAAVGKNSIAAECTNSIAEAQIPVALPPKELSADPGTAAAAQKPEHAETPPELGDRYEVLEFIGSGGMGSVWKVYDKQLDGTFAVKVLKPELLADATAVKRFEKEANLASDLTHANIAAIFGPGTDSQGRPFIIMGYVDGDSLADILACEGKLSEERALDIFTQICEALSHSHMKGIIHRDIKPSNIIISKTESGGDMVHIVDFGIARCIYDEVTKTQALTKAVDIFGSPRYMSPEQFLGNNVTGQSDIYSLGCVFYEMLTGAPPFTDENPVKLILQHISETPDLSKIPLKLQSLFYNVLAKEPEQRVPTVDRLLEDISSLHSNRSVDCQPTHFIHSVMAVGLILISCLTSLILNLGGSFVIPGSSLLLTLIWLYSVVVNRDNAGRSINYKLFELNLFFAAVASVAIDSLAITHHPILILLITPWLVASSVWMILQPRVIEVYSRCMTAIAVRAMSCRPRLLLKHGKLLRSFGAILLQLSFALLGLIASVLVVLPTLLLSCGAAFDCPTVTAVLFLFLSMFVFINFFAVLLRLFLDVIKSKRTVGQSLRLSLRLQTAMTAVVLFSTLAITSTVGRGGFNQFIRQDFEGLDDKRKQQQVRLEALTYPDSFYANQARLIAASYLLQSDDHVLNALTLCQQIIESKKETDPVTLASAYSLRFKIHGLKGKAGSEISDLEKALNLLEGAKSPSLSDVDANILSIFRPSQVEREALAVAALAIKNNYSELGKRALELASKHGIIDPSSAAYRNKLQAKIDALAASKPTSAIDRK